MKEIILSRTDRIGDVALTTATFAPLKQRFPDARIRILVQPALVQLLGGDERIEAVACPSGKGAKGAHPARIRHWRNYFRNHPADCIVFLHPDNDLQLAASLARIPRRIGYRKQIGALALNESIPYRRHLGKKHEAICNFDLLTMIGCPVPQILRPVIHVSSEIKVESPYAVFHPAAFGGKPRWPARHYARLAKRIIDRLDWKIVLIGSEPCRETVDAMRAEGILTEKWEDRGGKDSLAETAALLKGAKMVISRDSGPAHLAAALGSPLICLMGQCDPIHSPARWAPIGAHTHTIISDLSIEKGENRQARWKRCFEAIQPRDVFQAVLRLNETTRPLSGESNRE